MKNYLSPFLIAVFCLVTACAPDPANNAGEWNGTYNPAIHTLEKIELNGADTLALSPQTDESLNRRIMNPPDCNELGELRGAIYSKLQLQGNGQGPINPCFKNVGFWKTGAVFGQYTPENATEDVWFVTDEEGNVHHLPGIPHKGRGFKNQKIIRIYKGKPTYLNLQKKLVSFDLDTDEEETIIDYSVWRYAILDRPDGKHIVYQDEHGAGKRLKPDEVTEALGVLNNSPFFYANESQDLEYQSGSYLKRTIFNHEGEIVSDASSAVPAAYAEWLGTVGNPPPYGPVFSNSMEDCERQENIMVCGGKGYLIAGSSEDVQEIDWCDFGHCSWEDGWDGAHSCINADYLYFYSKRLNEPKLTRVSRTLDEHSDIFTNIEVFELACSEDGGILVKGYNVDTSSSENFHYKDAVKTILTAPVNKFIR